jgi:hypothetical protein
VSGQKTGINCHFVSRFFTKPWEMDQRRLWCFDFEKNQLQTRSSESLFARVGLNTKEMEERLDRLIETPLSNARQWLLDNRGGGRVEIRDWRVHRALLLLIPAQTARMVDASGRDTGTLEGLLSRPDEELDQMAYIWTKLFSLTGHVVPPGQRLCYPSVGYFAFPTPDVRVGLNVGFAVPMNERSVIAVVPPTTDNDLLVKRISEHAYLPIFSVGPDKASPQVVLHPDLKGQLNDPELIAELRRQRQVCNQMFELIGEVHKKLREADQITGLPVFARTLDPFAHPPEEITKLLQASSQIPRKPE